MRDTDGTIRLDDPDGTNILRTPVTLSGHRYRRIDDGAGGPGEYATLSGRRADLQLIITDARIIVCDPGQQNDAQRFAGHIRHPWIGAVAYSRRYGDDAVPALHIQLVEASPHAAGEHWEHVLALEFDASVHPGMLAMDLTGRIASHALRIGAPKRFRDEFTALATPPRLPNPPRGDMAAYELPAYVSRPGGGDWIGREKTRAGMPDAGSRGVTAARTRSRHGGGRAGPGGSRASISDERKAAALAAATPTPEHPPRMFAVVQAGTSEDTPSALHPTRNPDCTVHLLPIDGDDPVTLGAKRLVHRMRLIRIGDLGDGLAVKNIGEETVIAGYRGVRLTVTHARLIIGCRGRAWGGLSEGGSSGGGLSGGGELLGHVWYPWIRSVAFRPRQGLLDRARLIVEFDEVFPDARNGHWRHRLELTLPRNVHPGVHAQTLTRRVAGHDLLVEPPQDVWQRFLALTDSPVLPDPPAGEHATYVMPAHVKKPGGVMFTAGGTHDWRWSVGR